MQTKMTHNARNPNECICCGLNLSLIQSFLNWFQFLFAIVPDYGNEYTTKENKN